MATDKITVQWDAENDCYLMDYDDSDGKIQRIAFSVAEAEKIVEEFQRELSRPETFI